MKAEPSHQREVIRSVELQALAVEFQSRLLSLVKELGAKNLFVEAGGAGVEARQLDPDPHLGFTRIRAVDPELTAPTMELPSYLAQQLVAKTEPQRRSVDIDRPKLSSGHRVNSFWGPAGCPCRLTQAGPGPSGGARQSAGMPNGSREFCAGHRPAPSFLRTERADQLRGEISTSGKPRRCRPGRARGHRPGSCRGRPRRRRSTACRAAPFRWSSGSRCSHPASTTS